MPKATAKKPAAPRVKVEVAMSESTRKKLKSHAKKNHTSMSEILGDYAKSVVRK